MCPRPCSSLRRPLVGSHYRCGSLSRDISGSSCLSPSLLVVVIPGTAAVWYLHDNKHTDTQKNTLWFWPIRDLYRSPGSCAASWQVLHLVQSLLGHLLRWVSSLTASNGAVLRMAVRRQSSPQKNPILADVSYLSLYGASGSLSNTA